MIKLFAPLILCSAAWAQSYPLIGGVYGSVLDPWPHAPNLTGDTHYCTKTAATLASGASAGTYTYVDPSNVSHTAAGKILCMFNDGSLSGSSNIGIYFLDVLDMVNPANNSVASVNSMTSYGGGSAYNSPAGWFGKLNTNDFGGVTETGSWKSGQPFSVSGWVVLPVCRQLGGGSQLPGDCTYVVSPDAGAHWCNPNTYFTRTGGAGCDSVNWDANGDAPKCSAVDNGHSCTDAGYVSSAHSSVMWPWTGIMQDIKFFSYCGGGDLASCTGMPDGADTHAYAISYEKSRTAAYLSRVSKNINSILDPTQTQWYAQSNYSPTNPGNGTTWTTLGSQSGAITLWSLTTGTGPRYYNVPNYGLVWGGLNYLCAGLACSYVWVPAGLTSTISIQHPWGPFYSNGSGNTGSAFFNLLPWTAQTVNTTPYSLNIASIWNNYGGVTFYPGLTTAGNVITEVTKGNPTILTSTSNWGTFSGTWRLTVTGETANCWSAINGATTATWVSPTSFSIPVDTSA